MGPELMASTVLKELISLIGLPACLALTKSYGGRTLRIPIRESTIHPLCSIVGADAAGKLRSEYGGVHIEIPSERTALLEQRNLCICAEVGEGRKISHVANRYGLSRKMVRKIVQQGKAGHGPTLCRTG